MRRLVLLSLLAGMLLAPSAASASPYVQYGVQDDAWLQYGPGTLDDRLDRLQSLGVDIVRVTIDWRAAEPTRGDLRLVDDRPGPAGAARPAHRRSLLTLYGTPAWANGGARRELGADEQDGVRRVRRRGGRKRYPFVKKWAIWNEPNQRRWLRPTSPPSTRSCS